MPITDTGAACDTSASSAPRVMASRTPHASATATTCSQNVRQRSWGSVPSSSTTSVSVPGTVAVLNSKAGHTISRWWPSSRRTRGRVAEKSKNSSGSMWANGSAPQRSCSQRTALLLASPASFHPSKAAIRTGLVEVRAARPADVLHGPDAIGRASRRALGWSGGRSAAMGRGEQARCHPGGVPVEHPAGDDGGRHLLVVDPDQLGPGVGERRRRCPSGACAAAVVP